MMLSRKDAARKSGGFCAFLLGLRVSAFFFLLPPACEMACTLTAFLMYCTRKYRIAELRRAVLLYSEGLDAVCEPLRVCVRGSHYPPTN
jgi:hypothetical protein